MWYILPFVTVKGFKTLGIHEGGRMKVWRLFLAFLIALAVTVPARAQSGGGTVSGTLVDESGAAARSARSVSRTAVGWWAKSS